MTEADTTLVLDDEERELVGEEVGSMLPAFSGERRQRYERLAEAVEDAAVPVELQRELESVLELALQTARARQLYSAEGERILTGLYRRTPGGRELTEQLDSVNQALRAVAGHTLRTASVRMRTLGHFTVTLDTDAAQIVLAVRPDGVSVDSVGVGDGGGGG